MAQNMRIAIVNNLATDALTIKLLLLTVAECELAWIAENGADAVLKCAQDIPDLILMDLIMPIMDGVEATRQIMKNSPCAILILTTSVGKNAAKVFEAIGYGAVDSISIPAKGFTGNSQSSQALLDKITTIGKLIGKSRNLTAGSGSPKKSFLSPTPQDNVFSSFSSRLPALIAIGSSTGGPNALAAILSRLPANFSAAIAIIQHVDAQFTPGLVEWLNQQTPLTVQIALSGTRLEVGKVSIACTNDHLCLQQDLTLSYTKNPIDYPYRPSVDVFFQSIAKYWTRNGTAVLLTGMGKDGAQGLSTLRKKGWHTIAQNQDTSIVYGMPKAAIDLGAAIETLPLELIAPTLIKLIK